MVDDTEAAQPFQKRMTWLYEHLRNRPINEHCSGTIDGVRDSIRRSTLRPPTLRSRSGGPGMATRKDSFVTGNVWDSEQGAAFRLTGYRSNQWIYVKALDSDKILKPTLDGLIGTYEEGSEVAVKYWIDARTSCRAFFALVGASIALVLAGLVCTVILGFRSQAFPSSSTCWQPWHSFLSITFG